MCVCVGGGGGVRGGEAQSCSIIAMPRPFPQPEAGQNKYHRKRFCHSRLNIEPSPHCVSIVTLLMQVKVEYGDMILFIHGDVIVTLCVHVGYVIGLSFDICW